MDRKSIYKIIKSVKPLDEEAMNKISAYSETLAKPKGGFGILEFLMITLAGITGKTSFDFSKKANVIFAADNGIYEEGYNPYPQELSAHLFQLNMQKKGAGAVFAKALNVDNFVIDVGLSDKKTNNICNGPAMTTEEMFSKIEIGYNLAIDLVKKGYGVLSCGEIGLCNTSTAAAIISVLTNKDVLSIAGNGCGSVGSAYTKKVDSINKAITINNPDSTDPFDVLQKLGGFEICAMVGFYLGAIKSKVPVVLDGFISYSAALILSKLDESLIDRIIPSHLSCEKGSESVCKDLGIFPYINMGLRAGEGTGALLMMPHFDIVENVVKNLAVLKENE